MLLEQVLKQCGNDLSRENIIRQAKNLKEVVLPTTLPGIKINTSEKINMNYTQMRMQRWTGTKWDLFTEALDAASD
jgi:branched-chain amino acid transport system substrate-binding protein